MTHTHPLEGDGIQINLFNYLWKKGPSGGVDRGPLNVRIPHTIVFHNFPVAWYYWSQNAMEIRKKGGSSLDPNYIFQAFCKNHKAEVCDIIASFVWYRPGEQQSIEFLTKETLAAFLKKVTTSSRTEGDVRLGLLQQFVLPKGDHNNMLQAIWSTRLFLVVKRINRQKLDARHCDQRDKAVTFEGLAHFSEEAQVAPSVAKQAEEVCKSIVEHFKSVEHRFSITRMVVYLKEDRQSSTIWLLFSSSFRVSEQKFAMRKTPVSLTPQFKGIHFKELKRKYKDFDSLSRLVDPHQRDVASGYLQNISDYAAYLESENAGLEEELQAMRSHHEALLRGEVSLPEVKKLNELLRGARLPKLPPDRKKKKLSPIVHAYSPSTEMSLQEGSNDIPSPANSLLPAIPSARRVLQPISVPKMVVDSHSVVSRESAKQYDYLRELLTDISYTAHSKLSLRDGSLKYILITIPPVLAPEMNIAIRRCDIVHYTTYLEEYHREQRAMLSGAKVQQLPYIPPPSELEGTYALVIKPLLISRQRSDTVQAIRHLTYAVEQWKASAETSVTGVRSYFGAWSQPAWSQHLNEIMEIETTYSELEVSKMDSLIKSHAAELYLSVRRLYRVHAESHSCDSEVICLERVCLEIDSSHGEDLGEASYAEGNINGPDSPTTKSFAASTPRTSNSIPQSPQRSPRTSNSIPQSPQRSPRTSNSIPQSPQRSPRTSNSIPQSPQRSPRTSNSIPQSPHPIPHQLPLQSLAPNGRLSPLTGESVQSRQCTPPLLSDTIPISLNIESPGIPGESQPGPSSAPMRHSLPDVLPAKNTAQDTSLEAMRAEQARGTSPAAVETVQSRGTSRELDDSGLMGHSEVACAEFDIPREFSTGKVVQKGAL